MVRFTLIGRGGDEKICKSLLGIDSGSAAHIPSLNGLSRRDSIMNVRKQCVKEMERAKVIFSLLQSDVGSTGKASGYKQYEFVLCIWSSLIQRHV